MGPEVSLLAISLLLVNIWTPTIQAIPPKKLVHPHSPAISAWTPDWQRVTETMAREAENPPDPESASWYKWFFGPDRDTHEKRVRHLQEHGNLLGALQHEERSHYVYETPTYLPPTVKAHLQAELDVGLFRCIDDALRERGTDFPTDFPTSAKQCEEEYTVHLGVEKMKGRLGAEHTSQIEWSLTLAYKKCRAEGNTKQYCRYQTTAVVNGQTLKGAPRFLPETRPPQKTGFRSSVRASTHAGALETPLIF